MIFTRKKKISSPFSIRIGQNIINHKTNVKYLGVVIDEKMSWKNHVNYLCSKLAKGCWAISKLRKYVDLHTSRILYYSLIYPHLQYCISSWGRATKSVLKPLSIIQKRVLRLITKAPYRTPSAPLFFQLKVDDVYKLQIAKMMHHINNQNNTGTWTINNSIKLEKLHNHNTRASSQYNFVIPNIRTNSGKSLSAFAGAQIWREVPLSIKSLSTLKFKNCMLIICWNNTNQSIDYIIELH